VYVRDIRVVARTADRDCSVEAACGLLSARGGICLLGFRDGWGVQRRWWAMLAVAGYARIGPERLVEVGIVVDVVEGWRPPNDCGDAAITSQREGRRYARACILRPSPPAIVETHPTHHGGEVGWRWPLVDHSMSAGRYEGCGR